MFSFTFLLPFMLLSTLHRTTTTTIKPIKYIVTLEFNFIDSYDFVSFNGSVSMEFKALNLTDNIQVNAKHLEINISSVEIRNQNGELLPIAEIQEIPINDQLHIKLHDFLNNSRLCNLTVGQFSGRTYLGSNTGVKLGRYLKNYNRILYIFTEFERKGAREVFPCMDEPDLKAKFVFNIIRPKKYFTLSNTKAVIMGKDLGNGRYLDVFEETPIMPSYNLGFVISDFIYKRNGSHRIFGPPEVINSGCLDEALSAAIRSEIILKEYLRTDYVIEKMDQVVVEGMNVGGLENWGLILYKKPSLCYNPSGDGVPLENVISLVSHEMAHQWFGNLVTMKTWDSLWLKEGFATYFSFYVSREIAKERKELDILLIEENFDNTKWKSMMLEKRNGSIRTLVERRAISFMPYAKGMALIDMMVNFLTPEIFQESLVQYLQKFKFGSVESSDLYDTITDVLQQKNSTHLLGGHKLHDIMHNWEYEIGYPIVTISMNYSSGNLILQQESSLPNSDILWHIPISLKFGSDIKPKFWLSQKNITYTNEINPTNTWFIANVDFSGYYQVNYDEENWIRITRALCKNVIQLPTRNRKQLLQIAIEMAKRPNPNLSILIKFGTYLRNEDNMELFNVFFEVFNQIQEFMINSGNVELFARYFYNIFEERIKNMTYRIQPEDPDFEINLKINAMKIMCYLGDVYCRHSTLQLYHEWLEGTYYVRNTFYLQAMLCSAMRSANREDWERLYNRYLEEKFKFRWVYFVALGCTGDDDILKEFFSKLYAEPSTLPSYFHFEIFKMYTSPSSQAIYQQLDEMDLDSELVYTDKLKVYMLKFLSKMCYQEECKKKFESYINTKACKNTLCEANIKQNAKFKQEHGEIIIDAFKDVQKKNYFLAE